MKENELKPEEMFREEEQKVDLFNPDPDPETEKMIEEMEKEADKRTPEGLLLDVMENVCDVISITIAEAKEWGASTAQMLAIDEKVNELAETALSIYRCIEAKNGLNEARSMLDKLHLMRDVEKKNDESIRKWSEAQ